MSDGNRLKHATITLSECNINVILSNTICAGTECQCLSSSHPTTPPTGATFAKGSTSPDLSGVEVRAVVAQKVTISSAELSIVDREQESSRRGKLKQ